ESPRWHDGRLWFSDWGAREVVTLGLDGRREVVHRMATFPFSLDWLPDGRLLIVSTDLQRQEPDGSLVTHTNLSHLAAGWNEIVVDGRGNAYVDQAGFDLMSGAEPASGTIALATPDGIAREVADDVWFPNGMAITPDDSTLIVAESYRNRLTAFDIDESGDLSNRRVWADVGTDHPDGICVDEEGAIWYADVANRHCVRVREGGEVLQTITVDRGCFSCALGGPSGRTLFIVATQWHGPEHMFQGDPTGQVLTVDVASAHAGHP
ncbi:MAG: SMP-30/gluconolactonase/LRE family protein, partial [Candidatus Dormibacteraeota bacterium]|nr:SMP-30/gluconolactonase/LRE family protein [Candidatus Dormibacteraeota bacterium]